jgi:uncharacterized protein YndB with AHSA1/START domain
MFIAEARIEAPVDQVWQWLSDPAKMSNWMAGVEGMQLRGGKSMCQGAVLDFRSRGGQHTSEVVDFSEPTRLTLRSTQGQFTATYRYSLAEDGTSTLARLEADCHATGWAVLVAPLIRFLASRADRGQMEALRDAVQSAPPRS